MQKKSQIDPISQMLEREVALLNFLNDRKYYNLLEKIDRSIMPITQRLVIIPLLRRYRQQQIGRYGLYNWYFRLWGLNKPLQPDLILARTIVLFSSCIIIGLLASFISFALTIVILLVGYWMSSRFLSLPQNTIQNIRNMVLMHYPQAASVFAARDVNELLEILQGIDAIGYEVQSLVSLYINDPSPDAPDIETALGDYLNRHPLSSMALIKDMLDTFKTQDSDVRKQQKMNIMRQFPMELTEYFTRVTNDYKQIQTTSLMFSEMVVFASFMMLAIFGLIESPFSLLLPAVVVTFSDLLIQPLMLKSLSIRLFYNYNLAEHEKSLRKKLFKVSYGVGAIIAIIFGLLVPDFKMGFVCMIIGIPAVGYMLSSVFAVIAVEQENPPVYLHKLIREHIAIISAIRKQIGESSMLNAFERGIRTGYHGPLEDIVKPIVADIHMNVGIHQILENIYEKAYNSSPILRPYVFFLEKIIETSPIKGKRTETNPSELFDVIYEISTQVLRPLAIRFETIILMGVSRANFTGVINGITTGIFVILGKIFQNVLMKGLGSMGNVMGPSSGDIGNWMHDFMVGMIGNLTGTDLIAASLVSLSGTYLGVYAFQSKRTGAYILSVISAIATSYFGYKLMEKIINIMINMV